MNYYRMLKVKTTTKMKYYGMFKVKRQLRRYITGCSRLRTKQNIHRNRSISLPVTMITIMQARENNGIGLRRKRSYYIARPVNVEYNFSDWFLERSKFN